MTSFPFSLIQIIRRKTTKTISLGSRFLFPNKMLSKNSLLIFIALHVSTNANFSPISYDKSGHLAVREPVKRVHKPDPMKLTYEILKNTDFSESFKNLHRYLSPEEVRMVSTLGLLSSALCVEESMRENLYAILDNLLDAFNVTTPMENMKKLLTIEHTVNRDRSVVKVLNEMIQYARNATTLENLQKEMLNILNVVSVNGPKKRKISLKSIR